MSDIHQMQTTSDNSLALPDGFQKLRDIAKKLKPFQMRRHLIDTPRHHYKYMRFDGSPDCIRNLKTLIVDSNFYLSSPSDFNDPFEFRFRVTRDPDAAAVRKRLRHWASTQPTWKSLANKKRETWISNMMASLPNVMDDPKTFERHRHGVTCLASDPRDLLMWAHYADSHKGICVQFRTAFDPGIFAAAQPVDYCDDYPELSWPRMNGETLKAILVRKAKRWAYENERRIVFVDVPTRLLPFQSSCLSGIILGCNFPNSAMRHLEKLLAQRDQLGHPPIRIYRADANRSMYKLRVLKA